MSIRSALMVCAVVAAVACGCNRQTGEQPEPLHPEVNIGDGTLPPPEPRPADEADPEQPQPQVEPGEVEPEPAEPDDGTKPQPFDNSEPAGEPVCEGKYRAGEQFKRDCNTCACGPDGQIRCTLMACLSTADGP